jgi:hypothetical protein
MTYRHTYRTALAKIFYKKRLFAHIKSFEKKRANIYCKAGPLVTEQTIAKWIDLRIIYFRNLFVLEEHVSNLKIDEILTGKQKIKDVFNSIIDFSVICGLSSPPPL